MDLSFLEYIIKSFDIKITFSILSDPSFEDIPSIIIITKSILIFTIFFLSALVQLSGSGAYWNCCHSERNPCQRRVYTRYEKGISAAFSQCWCQRKKCNKRQAKYLSNQFSSHRTRVCECQGQDGENMQSSPAHSHLVTRLFRVSAGWKSMESFGPVR